MWVHWALGSPPNPDATGRSVGEDWAVRHRRVASSVACAPETGAGGRCPPVSCHLQIKILGKGGASFFVAKAVTGVGGGFRGAPVGHAAGSTTRVHSSGKLRCDSTFYRGGTARARVSNRIGVACHPTTVAGRVVWSRHLVATLANGALFLWFSLLAKCVVTAPAGGDAAGCCELGVCQHSDATRLSVGGGMCLTLCPVASGVACHPTTGGGCAVWTRQLVPPRTGREVQFLVLAFSFGQNVLSPLPPPPTRWGAVHSMGV